MESLVKLVSSESPTVMVVVLAVLLLAIVIAILFTVAFFQGRSVSFWPPTIGEHNRVSIRLPIEPEDDSSILEKSITSVQGFPIRGTVLQTASGKHFKVLSDFYTGANSTLYKAEELGGGVSMAKIYWRGLQPHSQPWDLFRKEVRASEVLNHRNIAKTLDRGLYSGYPFTILEYFPGGTLRDWFETHSKLRGEDILSIASQIGSAIDYAHSRGVIHRDISPGNILFEAEPQDRVVLSDFGVAAILGAIQMYTTAIGSDIAGSPAYLAPEVAAGDAPSPSMDIYSFGVVIFEMICKQVPFAEQQSPASFIYSKTTYRAPDIRTIREDVPADIALRLAHVLDISPALRPATASLVVSGLEESIRKL